MRRVSVFFALMGLMLFLMGGCGGAAATPTQPPQAVPTAEVSQTITLGDIDPDEPAKKIKRFQPLADYLAENLRDFNIEKGQVVIARDIPEMGRFLNQGTVDIFFDSAFPTLGAQELSGSKIILRRWKQADPEYWSVFISRRDSGIASVEGFVGKVVAFEEPRSTSGYVLPAGTLVQRGFTVKEVPSAQASATPGEIGYFFSRDEENTVELVLQGHLAGGGVSNQDYDELPPEIQQQLIAFDRTITVPRQLVSVRPGLDTELVSKVRELLTGLVQTEEGLQILKSLKKTKKFDALPAESEASLVELKRLMDLVSSK